MKYRVVVFSAVLMLAAIALAQAAGVDGKWVAQVPGRGGQTRETTFTFKADGTKLTGTVSGMQGEVPIADGKINGDEISFTQTFEAQGNSIKVIYTGKVSGDEIKMTRKRDGGDQPATEFTAKRAK
ncbi:MAG TPA: hypothetical protein VNO24_27915 [Blastocatellia bacterium]|nr:hypothetical protein [Blastocatellia bacterium]